MLDARMTIDPEDFEVIEYDTEWVKDFSADIGGYDGTLPVCIITKAEVTDFDGDTYEADRGYLLEAFGPKSVAYAEELLAERVMDQ